MKIGMVCPYSFDEPGGVQAHIIDVAQHFIDRGHDVRVIGPCSPETPVPSFVVKGGKSLPIPYNGSVARLSLGPAVDQKLAQFIEQGHFDVLHIHEPNSPSFSMRALKLAQGPIVATYHASSSGSMLLKAAAPMLRPLLEKVRGGIAVSEMARRWQVQQLGTDPVLIPNGVDTSMFVAARSKEAPASDGVVRVVFLGRIDEPRKGLQLLLEALHIDRSRNNRSDTEPELTVDVIGSGTPIDTPGVAYHGKVSDKEKARLLGKADIYVAPNTGGESFGIVLVEAMAAGCAVVASDIEAFKAVCNADSDSPAGLLFRSGDSDSLQQALRRAANDSALRNHLANAGRARAMEFDWDHVAASIMRVYETVADGSTVTLEKPRDKPLSVLKTARLQANSPSPLHGAQGECEEDKE